MYLQWLSRFRAKSKAEAVIESCVLGCHYDAAAKYINAYKIMYKDERGYHELMSLLQRKRIDSLSP